MTGIQEQGNNTLPPHFCHSFNSRTVLHPTMPGRKSWMSPRPAGNYLFIFGPRYSNQANMPPPGCYGIKKPLPAKPTGAQTILFLWQESASPGTNQGSLRPLVPFRDAEHNHIALIQIVHGDILQSIFMKKNLLLVRGDDKAI